jgi:hypothetical protein
VASVLDRLIPEDDHVVATVGAVYPLRHYWSLRVEESTSAGFPGTPTSDGRQCWIVTHEGRDRPPDLTAWFGAHAVKVGEVPASWGLPGLEIYRRRPQTGRTARNARARLTCALEIPRVEFAT